MKGSRVLLKKGNVIRKFLWVTQGRDRSVYLGMSESSSIIKTGEFRAGAHVSYSNGQIVKLKHTYPKMSFHRTGDVHIRSREKHTFLKSKKQSLNELEKPRLLSMIIPKRIELYPETTKRINDIEIPIDPFGDKPFAVNLYLGKKDFDFLTLRIKDAVVQVTAVGESAYFQLAVVAYQLRKFIGFPEQTYFIFKK